MLLPAQQQQLIGNHWRGIEAIVELVDSQHFSLVVAAQLA